MNSLYEQVCQKDNLLRAWEHVKEKGSVGGIDGVSLDDFSSRLDENLQRLSDDLTSGAYAPQPYQEVQKAKGNGEFRSLGLMCVRDKVAQQAGRELLEPILERMFLDVSYGYRKNKGTGKAIARVTHLIHKEKKEWVVRCDIQKYFDNINHDRLISTLSSRINDQRFIALVRVWLRMGKVDNRLRWSDSQEGIPQGGVISPLLSNFYLNPLDCFAVKQKMSYVRYADDFVVLCRSEEEANKAFRDIAGYLKNRLHLALNPESRVTSLAAGFQFLGITFRGGERLISDEKLNSLREKISKAVIQDGMATTEKLRETLRGIENYYGKIIPQGSLETLDECLAATLKEEARKAIEAGQLKNKQGLLDILNSVEFLSISHKIRKNRNIKGILAFATKKSERFPSPPSAEPGEKRFDPVRKRKREYQRLQSDGFELVVSKPGAFIGKTQKGIVIKDKGTVVHEAPLQNLKHIFVTSPSVTLSSNVIAYAAQRKIPIDFVEQSGMPYARIFPFHSPYAELQLAQLRVLQDGRCSELAKSIVHGKIKNQMNLAKYYHKYRKSFDEAFVREFEDNIGRMHTIAEELRSLMDADHEVLRGKLFSIEGRAAAAYWEIIKALLDEVMVFEGRVGQGASDLVNSMLNYGYGILYSKIWNAVSGSGLSPYISYLHKPQPGKPTLIYDLVEEFRPQAVDRVIFSMINKGVELKMDGKLLCPATRNKVAAGVLERINTMEKFRGENMRLADIIRKQAKAVGAYLLGECSRYSPYIGKW
jgi:group II intron reverse transcriptase/maturase/CRISPR-associated endonuclease Cas1